MTETTTQTSAVSLKKVENGVGTASELPEEKISDQDKHILETAIMQRKLTVAQAEKCLAEVNTAELAHKHIVLQLYMKYGMNVEKDLIDEQGTIKRNSVQPKDSK